jgi:AcrR family transcriptional regulator
VRADARRNRDRLVAVAQEVFTEQGAGASLDDIAKRAGVGPGTLYRHFPTREALQEAAYRDAVAELAERGRKLAGELPPGPALDAWVGLLVTHMRDRSALAGALVESMGKSGEVFVECHRLMHDAGALLVGAARAAGAVREDVQERDLLWMAHGVAQSAAGDGGDERAARLQEVLLRGLRP